MTKRMWFYPAAAFAVAAGLMASMAQASPATGSLNALSTGVSAQSNLVQKTEYRNWGWHYRGHYDRYRHYEDYNRHHHYWNNYRYHHYDQDYNRHRHYQYYNRYRGW